MPSLDGFSVRILCDGSPLEEYSTTVGATGPLSASCWITSERNKRFSVEYKWSTTEVCHFRLSLKCDGVAMRDSIVKPTSRSHIHDKARGPDGYFEMMFSELIRTDNEEAALREVSPSLGVITVKIWRVKIRGELDPESRDYALSRSRLDTAPIHESKKKMGGHRIALGEMVGSRHQAHLDVAKLDTRPLRTFNFYYRPKDILRALGHLPEPKAITGKRRMSQRSENEDKDELVSEEEEVISAKMHVLSQQLESLRSKKKRVKREVSPIVVPEGQNNVIDLTSD